MKILRATKGNSTVEVGLIPWRCFATQNETMCTCTVLNEKHVLVRSACLYSSLETEEIHVYAGASLLDNADQMVRAAVLNTTEPPPEGIFVLKLDNGLKLDKNF